MQPCLACMYPTCKHCSCERTETSISPQGQTLRRSDHQIPNKDKRDRDRDRGGNPNRRPETQTQTVTIVVLQPELMPGKGSNPHRQTDPQTFSPQTLEPDALVHPQIPNKDKRDRDRDRNQDRKPETQTIHTDRQTLRPSALRP